LMLTLTPARKSNVPGDGLFAVGARPAGTQALAGGHRSPVGGAARRA
jgi:hypothetical protein